MPFGTVAMGIGSLVGAGLGLTGLATSNSNYKQQVKSQKELMGLQYNYNEKAAEEAYRREQEMYERTFNDSSYATQKKRMEEAGLNVGLMYSGGASGAGGAGHIGGGKQGGGAGAAAAPNAMMKSQIAEQAGMGMQQAMQTAADVRLKKAQADNLDADTEKKRGVDTEKVTAEIESLKATTGYTELRSGMQKIENMRAQATLETDIQRVKTDLRRATYEAMEAAETYTQAQIKTEVDGATKEANIQAAWLGVAQATAEIALKGAQIKYTDAQREALGQQILQGWANVGLRKGELGATLQKISQDKTIWGEQMSENAKGRAIELITAPLMNGVFIRNSSVNMKELLSPGGDVSGIKQW